MAMSMPPPVLPAYSLRVQLFAPNAYSLDDKPIRNFRVVTSPEATLREFCQEASRIHEINYGKPLAVKKVQDDLEFDLTQEEILGNLFTNAATIRVIQASAHPEARDSVPPTSGLRYDPTSTIDRKRDRSASPRVNGSAQSSLWKPNKRQRISDLDPDQPLPSNENRDNAGRANGRILDTKIIPNSQESVILGRNNGQHNSARPVRPALLRISETPDPSPLPTLQNYANYEDYKADQQARKSANGSSNFFREVQESSPPRDGSPRPRSQLPNPRAKSASYHIQRATERGTSVSTAATSPLSGDQQQPPQQRITGGNKRKASEPVSNSRKPSDDRTRSPNEENVYENVESENEGAAILRSKKSGLKIRSSPNSSLQGLEWAKKKFNTPPNARRKSQSGDEDSASGELQLTPKSKEREIQKQRQEVGDTRRARIAAAEAAEQRKRDADEARRVEENRIAEEERAEREEEERIEIEEFKRAEAEVAQIKTKAAARLQKEQEAEKKRRKEGERPAQTKNAQGKREVEAMRLEEEKRHEQARAARAKRQAEKKRQEEEKLRKQQRNEREIAERNGIEEAEAKEAKRIADEADRREQEAKAEKLKRAKEQVEVSRMAKSSSPTRHLELPPDRPKGGTSFYPSSRKPPLKSCLSSSQAVGTSSPAAASLSPEVSFKGVGIEAQMPLPKPSPRRVSFAEKQERPATPIKPSTSGSTSSSPPAMQKPSSKPKNIVPPEKQSNTPILPPSTLRKPSNERSATPQVQTKLSWPQPQTRPSSQSTNTKSSPPVHSEPKKPSPQVASTKPSPPTSSQPKKVSPSAQPASRKSEIPAAAPLAKEKSKSAELKTRSPANADTSKLSSKRDIPSLTAPEKASSRSERRSPAKNVAPESEDNGDDDEDEDDEDEDEEDEENEEEMEMATRVSGRDSRSPVVFSRHPQSAKPQRHAPPEPESSSEDEEEGEEEDDDSDSNGSTMKKDIKAYEVEDIETSASEYDGSEARSHDSSPELPSRKPAPKPNTLRTASAPISEPGQNNSKTRRDDSDPNTQEQINQQLTSSMREARASAPPASTAAPARSSPMPILKVGASLSSLNAKKPVLAGKGGNVNGVRSSQLKVQQNEDEDSEEDSEEDGSDESSDDDDAPPNPNTQAPSQRNSSAPPKPSSQATNPASHGMSDVQRKLSTQTTQTSPQKQSARPAPESDSDDESDSSSDNSSSSSESDSDNEARARNTLVTQIAGMSSQSQTQSGAKKKDKYLTGYAFSQPL